MITTLTGSNSYALQAELNKRVQAYLADYDAMGLERIDGEESEFGRLLAALTSLPFLVAKKLVVLRNPSAQKVFSDTITELIDGVPESIDVIIVESKLDKRGSYYKTLKKVTEYIECNELDGPGLSRWLAHEAKNQSGNLGPADATYLVDRVGVNQQLLANELAKLLSYSPDVSRQTIDLLVDPTPQSTVFMLLDAALSGNARRALELYEDQRQQKVEPLAILAMLAWQLHILAVVKTGGERSPDTIAAEAKLNPYVVKKSQAIVRNVSLNTLKTWVHDLLQLDIRLKSESIDADEALRLQLLVMSQ